MRLRTLALLVLALMAMAAVAPTPGSASTCRTIRCLNNVVTDLQDQNARQSRKIRNQAIIIAALKDDARQAWRHLNCIGLRPLYQRYTYDYYGNYFAYLNVADQYGQGAAGGPWRVLQERQTDACVGIFS